MQLPKLTLHQIRSRCTEQSFERGLEYFHAGAIGNPVLQDWTLSATCQGSYPKPYRTSVELMPTGIAATRCSCPYDADGDPVYLKIEGEIAEDVREDISYNLEAIDPFETAEYIVEADFNSYNTGLMDMAIFQTFEGSIIREGFAFSYYMLDEVSELALEP